MGVTIGPPGLLLLLVLLVPVIPGLVTTIDVSSRPDWAFDRAGTSKTLWIVLPIAGLVLCGVVTIVAAIVWFTTVRPRVVAAAQAA
jgi:hypothetical protein